MSQKSESVVKALAGVAVIAGVGYVVSRRRARTRRSMMHTARSTACAADPTDRPTLPDADPTLWTEDLVSAYGKPDALDVALGFGPALDGERESRIELTARTNDHLPSLHAGDDEDAPSPDDLGSAWLKQATESERSLTEDDLAQDVDSLERASDELIESYNLAGEGGEDDETTREYVRRHRISLLG